MEQDFNNILHLKLKKTIKYVRVGNNLVFGITGTTNESVTLILESFSSKQDIVKCKCYQSWPI